jgi:hypothetical protein
MQESFEWVLRCISGSTTEWHFKTCIILVQLFTDQYYNQGGPWTSKLWDALRLRAHEDGIEIPYGMPGVIKAIQVSS